jgi:hypothetical protein
MYVFVVVFAQLLFLFDTPTSQGLLQVSVSVLAADHETDLAGRVGGDGGICVVDGGEDFSAVLLEFGDEWEV